MKLNKSKPILKTIDVDNYSIVGTNYQIIKPINAQNYNVINNGRIIGQTTYLNDAKRIVSIELNNNVQLINLSLTVGFSVIGFLLNRYY